MITRSTHSFYRELADVIEAVDAAEARRTESVERAKIQGFQLTPERKEKYKYDRLQDLRTGKERLERIRNDFKAHIAEESRPFSIVEIESAGGLKEKRITTLSRDERDLLDSMKYLDLSPEDYIYLGQYARDNDRQLLAHCIVDQAKKAGYTLSGVVSDPQVEIQRMEDCLKWANVILDGDFRDPDNVAECRQALKLAIDASYPFTETGAPKRAEISIKKANVELGENEGEITNTAPAEDLKEKVAFLDGFTDNGGQDLIETKALSEAAHAQFILKEAKQAKQSAQDAQKAEESDAVTD